MVFGGSFLAATGVKLILSRKGFDSGAGGCASPIMPDGSLLSLPIPDKRSPVRYEDITFRGYSVGRLVAELTRGKQKPHFGAHLDPDLVSGSYPRVAGWRGLLGQADSAQTVLEQYGVGSGDLFLFFGWFRRVEEYAGTFRFVKGTPDVHVLWGWLQVDTTVTVGTSAVPRWAGYHPHVASAEHRSRNTLYVARETLMINGAATGLPGAGVFAMYENRLVLTKPGANRSLWNLPAWFAPAHDRPSLGYHSEVTRWSILGDRVDLQTVARGQEFVLDTSRYPESLRWIRDLVTHSELMVEPQDPEA
jgi:hypothetical protein